MINRAYKVMFFLTIFAFCGCVATFAAETSFEVRAFENGTAQLIFADAPLKTMTRTPFKIILTDGAGDEITDATLQISMDMPAMPMPPNNPSAGWDGDAYRGEAIFTMAGAWEITVDIERQGLAENSVVFEIEQVMMK